MSRVSEFLGCQPGTVWVECSRLDPFACPVSPKGVRARRPSRFSAGNFVATDRSAPRSSLTLGFALRVRSESTRHGLRRAVSRHPQHPFHEVSLPTAFSEASSDLHQICLTWLCCVLGLFRTLDALFRSRPTRPCFMPVAPLGFCLQRFSLSGSQLRLSTRPAPPAFCFSPPAPVETGAGVGDRGFRGSCIRRIRTCAALRSPVAQRPILSWPSPLRGLLPSELDAVLPRRLLSWALT